MMEDGVDQEAGGSSSDQFRALPRGMADKRCASGHVIDEVWDLCPYCPSEPRRASAASVAAPASVAPIGRPEPSGRGDSRSWEPPSSTVMAPKAMTLSGEHEPKWVVGWLVAINGRMIGESLAIRGGRNVIGRNVRSDIVIPDDQVSSHHADIVYRSDDRRFILMDHHSTNGTFVNESEVSPRIDLVDRDVIRIGRQKFLFVSLCDHRFGWDQIEQRR